ncbi:hypothetical protein D9753_00870 [Streptomyces dangxiongensis]|uniref:Uncharacterized protein n=1 Tax=Streptomyces dangxiongensis TaxID=1442032 RepID=A0A3G2JAF3_9ACTN|nr:hypothetical protein [Streptomyces dangxiongensis]AYN37769.1 hypothetical protein D9753_00870 [Streptomyces dangxiongensis]
MRLQNFGERHQVVNVDPPTATPLTFAAPDAAGYSVCLFVEHAHSDEYDDADHWRTELLHHRFAPDLLCGDRSTAPVLSPPGMDPIHSHIVHQHHPEIGTVPLPTFPLVGHLPQLTSLP